MSLLRVCAVWLVALVAVVSCEIIWSPQQQEQYPQLLCSKNRLPKLYLNQSGYVQYSQYMAEIPPLTGFTLHYWFNLLNNKRSATFFNYGLNEAVHNNNISVQLEAGNPQFWKLEVNDVLVYRIPSIPVSAREWHHAFHSWDSRTGEWNIFLDGKFLISGVKPESRGLVIPGGGVGVSGQHQNTLHNGMDDGEGLEGWFTLFQLSYRPLRQYTSSAAIFYVARLASQCSNDYGGDVISWRGTPRKGYGGVMETPGSERCGHF